MINLGYGKIDDSFFDQNALSEAVQSALKKAKLTSYATPGGNEETKRAIMSYIEIPYDMNIVATSISTNLSLAICVELFSRKVHIFTPLFSNYFQQVKRINNKRIVVHDYGELVAGIINMEEICEGDLVIMLLPNNPTGELPSRDKIFDIVKVLHQKNVTTLFDLSWFETIDNSLGYQKNDIANLVYKTNSIVLLGFTKITGLSGIRCSGVVASKERISAFVKRHDELAISCGAFDEALLVEALKNGDILKWEEVRIHVSNNYLVLRQMLHGSGLEFNVRQRKAGIFAYFSIRGDINADAISEECKRGNLLVYPSTLFEKRNNGFRVNLGCDQGSFKEGVGILLSRIKNGLEK